LDNDLTLQPIVIEMLRAFEMILIKSDVDFYIVGATARDIHLATKPNLKAIRATNDIDIGILINSEDQFQKIKAELIATGNFQADSKEVIKLIYKQSIEIDLLPFGGIENDFRETRIEKPKLFIMDVPGFLEVFQYVTAITIDELNINVCSVEGLIILKLIAYDDRSQRTKDVTDVDKLVEVYFDLFADDVYENYFDVMELYDTDISNYLELVSARIIGRKIKKILSGSLDLLQRIETILSQRPTDTWQAIKDGLQD
jgi:predicted nucleotidyltransferase